MGEPKPLEDLTFRVIGAAMTYLCATGLNVGLLLNFGRGRLEYKRIFSPKNVERWRERITRYVWIPPDARSVSPLSIC